MDDELKALETAAEALTQKYADSLCDIEKQMATNDREITSLISNLTGDNFAIKGLNGLVNLIED